MANEFEDWYYSIPFFTRRWLTATVVLSILGHFSIIKPYNLVFDADLFLGNFQIWRAVTAVFYYPTSFNFLVNCYFLYSYSSRLESGTFAGKPADFLYMLLFNWICCVAAAIFVELRLLMEPMVLAVLYMWCILNKDVVVSFWFGTRFKAMYLPWVLLAFNIIVNGGGLLELLGILIGHLSYFLIFKYPQEFGGPAWLSPPSFFKQFFPDRRYTSGFGTAPETARNPYQSQGHNWGRGQTLGGN